MHDTGKVVIGLVAFLAVLSVPVVYDLASGKPAARPELKIVTTEKECVMPVSIMRAKHMEVLNQWRDSVVRRGEHIFTAANGRKYVMSLSNTCLGCHSNKKEFCDSCHTYAGVQPYCWGCHVVPEETK